MVTVRSFAVFVASSVASVALAASMLALAPAASADNYAPQLPSNRVEAGQKMRLVVTGGQAGCRVTYSVRNVGGSDQANRGLVSRLRVRVNADGVAAGTLRAPAQAGTFQLITRVDGPGCTPTKSVQRIVVQL